jgi:hypothetical protein
LVLRLSVLSLCAITVLLGAGCAKDDYSDTGGASKSAAPAPATSVDPNAPKPQAIPQKLQEAPVRPPETAPK